MSALATRLAVTATLMVASFAPALAAGPDGHGWTDADATALRELVEDQDGGRARWATAPELVVLASVMQFAPTDARDGYVATDETLSELDIEHLAAELTQALGSLTGGRITRFAAVRVEVLEPGTTAGVFRRNQIVAGRYLGLRERTGTLGFGGRTVRGGVITSGAVMLDQEYDARSSQRELLRTHELGHALGFNHVESRRSLMNRHVGAELTEFDRNAIALLASHQN